MEVGHLIHRHAADGEGGILWSFAAETVHQQAGEMRGVKGDLFHHSDGQRR